MHTYRGEANDLYPLLARDVLHHGKQIQPRGTSTLELHPVFLEIINPHRRLVTSQGRVVNVAFALAEVIWILGGQNDVATLFAYNQKINQFSDDGIVFNAAYGFRMRKAFGFDQLQDVVHTLTQDPNSRQAVVAIWDPMADNGWMGEWQTRNETRDRACNVMSHYLIRNEKLDLMQVVRSNDLVLGVPYNWMQWTHIQAYLAAWIGVEVGTLYNVIDSLHVYTDTYYTLDDVRVSPFDLYSEMAHNHRPIEHINAELLVEREKFVRLCSINNLELGIASSGERGYEYWDDVMRVLAAWRLYKEKKNLRALHMLINGDKVYGAAQARHFWHFRWKNFHPREKKELINTMLLLWPESVVTWITGEQ